MQYGRAMFKYFNENLKVRSEVRDVASRQTPRKISQIEKLVIADLEYVEENLDFCELVNQLNFNFIRNFRFLLAAWFNTDVWHF